LLKLTEEKQKSKNRRLAERGRSECLN
jgi:hypothetical protein